MAETPPLTDRRAVFLALNFAMKWEQGLLDSYSGMTDTIAMETRAKTKKNIEAFQRVLDRYFGGPIADPFKNAKSVSIYDILKGKPNAP